MQHVETPAGDGPADHPPLTDLIGLDPDFTGGLSPEEHLRRQRCGKCDEMASALAEARNEVKILTGTEDGRLFVAEQQRDAAHRDAEQARAELAAMRVQHAGVQMERDLANEQLRGWRKRAAEREATPAVTPQADDEPEPAEQVEPPCHCPDAFLTNGCHVDYCLRHGKPLSVAAPVPADAKVRTYRDMPVVKCHLVDRDVSHMAHVFDDEQLGGKVVCRGLLPHSVPMDAEPFPADGGEVTA